METSPKFVGQIGDFVNPQRQSDSGGTASTDPSGPGGSGTGESGAEKGQGIPRLVAVTIPESVEKKGPGRPRKNSSIPSPSAPKSASQKAAQQNDPQLEANIAAFIKTVFDITSLKAGPIWAVSVEESKAIAAPAARILERAGAGAVTGKYSDYFLLIFAIAGVVVPRAMMAKNQAPAIPQNMKKEVLPSGPKLHPVHAGNGAKGPANASAGQAHGKPAADGQNSIRESMPGLA